MRGMMKNMPLTYTQSSLDCSVRLEEESSTD